MVSIIGSSMRRGELRAECTRTGRRGWDGRRAVVFARMVALLSVGDACIGLAQAPAGAAVGSDSGVVYNVVIRGGHVLDGAGNPWIAADVAIQGGRFVRIGKVWGTGKTELDARGRYVSPGWIDMMDQSGGGAPQERVGADQGAGGGDIRHRRRGRPTGPDRLAGRLFPSSRATGDQHQFRDVRQ